MPSQLFVYGSAQYLSANVARNLRRRYGDVSPAMSPRISIILPFYNAERYLRTALESVRAQTLADFECICVDDGSTDGSAAVVEGFRSRDERFRLLRQGHKCAGAARNAGMAVAAGEWLAFLDADDSYEPEFLREMYAACTASDGIEVAVCAVYLQCDDPARPKRVCPEFLEPERFARGDVLDFTPGNPWNKMFSRNLVERLGFGFLDLPRSEDVGFVFPALAAAKRVAIVEKPLVNYRTDNSRSLEHTKGEAGCLVFYEAYLRVRDRLRELGIYDRVRASFIRRVARAILYNLSAPRSLTDFRTVHDRLRGSVVGDFEILQDVPTDFDSAIREFVETPLDDYLVVAARARLWRKRTVASSSVRVSSLQRQIAEIKGSFAYRAGLFLTAPGRFLCRLFRRMVAKAT